MTILSTTPIRLESEVGPRGLALFAVTSKGRRELPPLWLRERATSGCQRDAATGQRLFDPHQLSPFLAITALVPCDSRITVTFSDGFAGAYALDHLAVELAPPPLLPEKIVWTADLDPLPRFGWTQLGDAAYRFAMYTAYLQYGFILVQDTPTAAGSSSGDFFDVAAAFGFVKETAHGRCFEIKVKPVYNDLAYLSGALSPHTDMPYSNPMPGAQILQCVVNQTEGGLSTLVDALACCAALRAEDPEAYRLLAEIAVRFVFNDAREAILLDRPLLVHDEMGELQGVRYSPRLDFMPLLDADITRAYQAARRRLSALFTDAAFVIRFRLAPGEVMLFDNSRILHGRTAYDAGEGQRHLIGCYIDRDGPAIRYQALRRDHGFT